MKSPYDEYPGIDPKQMSKSQRIIMDIILSRGSMTTEKLSSFLSGELRRHDKLKMTLQALFGRELIVLDPLSSQVEANKKAIYLDLNHIRYVPDKGYRAEERGVAGVEWNDTHCRVVRALQILGGKSRFISAVKLSYVLGTSGLYPVLYSLEAAEYLQQKKEGHPEYLYVRLTEKGARVKIKDADKTAAQNPEDVALMMLESLESVREFWDMVESLRVKDGIDVPNKDFSAALGALRRAVIKARDLRDIMSDVENALKS